MSQPTTPTLGRIVHVLKDGEPHPAVISRVHSRNIVNLRVLLDGSNESPAVTSVYLHEDEATARAADSMPQTGVHAFWPARG